MTLLETYLRELREIRSTGAGVEEESYYHPLATLLNELGQKLKPKVKCVLQLANRGAGKPDGGLFTADQFQKGSGAPAPGQLPSRGAIEIKPTKDDAWVTAEAKQVTKYWNRYRQVLVTNYRDFVLVGQDFNGNAAILETYRLAENEKAFWAAAASPRATAEKQNDRFVEYLQRVMRHAAQIASPEDVAWFLASYARDALASIQDVELSALAEVRKALEEALGLKFEGQKGEHFFRSSLVQTLFYGIFSAWVLWSRQNPPTSRARFDWRLTAWSLRVPMISRLFSLVADPRQLDALKLSEALDWTGAVLNRVDRAAFFSKFEESHAVQYFYEPFLEAFDPELRKQLGVWYTPPEIVKYMVERVDTVLRQELGLPLGLADKNVYVLDPCCGTGSYLVEVLDRIHRTLKEHGEDGFTASDVKEAAQKRVFGFEILPAPFVVSHLQLGLLLERLGAPLAEKGQDRVAVYLTNALTGWEPPKGPKQHLMFKEMEEERDAAEHVKQEAPILVILGNPPYNGFAGVSPAEEQGLLDPYKEGLKEWGITKNYLDDLYVRFFRLAERRIAEKTRKGIVCFISNYSWLSDPTYVVVREHLLQSFDRFWVENLHGDRRISEYAPDGKTSETVFATAGFSVGIQQGVAVSLWVKSGTEQTIPRVLFRDDFTAAKALQRRQDLVASLSVPGFDSRYRSVSPEKSDRFSFRPNDSSAGYSIWPSVAVLCGTEALLGLNDNRGQATHAMDRSEICQRMRAYYNAAVPFEEIKSLHPGLTTDAASFDARVTREQLLARSAFSEDNVRLFWFRPFDLRWSYIERLSGLWNRIRPELLAQAWEGNDFVLTRRHAPKAPDGAAFLFSRHLADQHTMHTDAYFIPCRLRPVPANSQAQGTLVGTVQAGNSAPTANLSAKARTYLSRLGINNPDSNAQTAGLLWMHALAIGYSPAYLTENADGIRQDWPRIPLPDSRELLLASAALGRKIAALLDTEAPFDAAVAAMSSSPSISPAGTPALQKIAVPARGDGKPLDEAKDLAVTAGWGHAGKDGVTMPGKGRLIERDTTAEERGILLGDRTCDVYLNGAAYWKNIPIRVWEYTIGGYQVIKKWLSYREEKLLGRPMTKDEVRWVQEMAQRIAAILLLEPALDENYLTVKVHTYDWPEAKPLAAALTPD
ncbi:MAG: type ISP restriction/modification enzyme [Candidatus Acidiferrales bacterium]